MKTKINLLIFALVSFLFVACNNDQPKDSRDEIVGYYSYNMVSNSIFTTDSGSESTSNSDSGSAHIKKDFAASNGIILVLNNTEYSGEYHNGQIFINSKTETESGYLDGIYTTITASFSFSPASFRNNAFTLNGNAVLVLRAGGSSANGTGRIQWQFLKK